MSDFALDRALFRPQHLSPRAAPQTIMKAEYVEKQREYEEKKARAKALQLRLTCTICGAKPRTLLKCPCGTTQYCSTDCQRIDWRERGHRKACKKLRKRAAEAPTRAPSPPRDVFYGPAPRSHADEIRARIAAEHEAARVRREANPEPEPASARWGSRCPICFEDWDVNQAPILMSCCCRMVCAHCVEKFHGDPCPLCRMPCVTSQAAFVAQIRRHAENDVPEAVFALADMYKKGNSVIVGNHRKAVKIFKRAVELGSVDATNCLGEHLYYGFGVKADRRKAIKCFRMAADRGHVIAQHNLASCLREADGSSSEAVKYFLLAAQQGLTSSEHDLGVCYRDGEGTEVDLGKARYWFQRAAAKGNEEATDALAHLDARV